MKAIPKTKKKKGNNDLGEILQAIVNAAIAALIIYKKSKPYLAKIRKLTIKTIKPRKGTALK